MKRLFFLVAITACIYSSLREGTHRSPAGTASAFTINLYSGINQGGYGDIASNLYMHQKIISANPEAKFNVIINPYSLEKMKSLMPELVGVDINHNLAIRGVNYIVEDVHHVPDADIFISFSGPLPKRELSQKAKLTLSFAEYGEKAPHPILNKGSVENNAYWLESGVFNYGLYTSYDKPASNLTAIDFVQQFNQDRPFEEQLPRNFDSIDFIGHAYASNPQLEENYIRLYSKIAQQNPHKKYLIVAKNFSNLQIPNLTSNMQVVRYNNIKFSLMQELFKRTNLPVLVTGDMSLTLAIDHGLIPLYERLPHKAAFSDELFNYLAEQTGEYKKDVQRLGDFASSENKADHLVKLLQDEVFLKRTQRHIANLKRESSMATTIQTIIDRYKTAPLEMTNESGLSFLLHMMDKNEAPRTCSNLLKKI